MQSHPYTFPMRALAAIRKAVKWGGLTLTALLVAAWIGSAWCGLSWMSTPTTRQYELYIGRGRLGITRFSFSAVFGSPGFDWYSVPFKYPTLDLWFHWFFGGPNSTVVIPVWFPAILSGALTLLAWRPDLRDRRRQRLGHCSKCGYDLAGITKAVCPECGRLQTPARVQP